MFEYWEGERRSSRNKEVTKYKNEVSHFQNWRCHSWHDFRKIIWELIEINIWFSEFVQSEGSQSESSDFEDSDSDDVNDDVIGDFQENSAAYRSNGRKRQKITPPKEKKKKVEKYDSSENEESSSEGEASYDETSSSDSDVAPPPSAPVHQTYSSKRGRGGDEGEIYLFWFYIDLPYYFHIFFQNKCQE